MAKQRNDMHQNAVVFSTGWLCNVLLMTTMLLKSACSQALKHTTYTPGHDSHVSLVQQVYVKKQLLTLKHLRLVTKAQYH